MTIQLSDHFSYKRLLRFALPSILMMIFTSIYSVVDGFFISNYVGKTPFAAVNFIFPYLMILGSLGFMIGSGGSALVGKTLGEQDTARANGLFSMLVYVTVIAGFLFMAVGYLTIGPVALWMGADESMLPDCLLYARINLIGLPVLMLQYEFQSFFITAEKPQLGLYITVSAGVINMVLDWLLVGVIPLGIPGAAIATVASQFVGGLGPIFYFFRKNDSLLKLGKPVIDPRALWQTLSNGASEFVSNISMSLVSMLYNAQLMKYAGEDGVAAYGVLMYVSMIFMAIYIGYAVGTAPIVSFHYGAGNQDELKSLLAKSLRIVLLCGLLMLAAGELLARPMASLFAGYDPDLLSLTLRGFRIFSFSFIFAEIPIYGSSFFTALNDGMTSATISFLRTVVFQVGAVLLLPLLLGVDGIWLSMVAAEVVACAVTVFFWVTKRKKYGY